ncbi:hypothetical protein JHK87_047800 [Glycine soja]|nr:hypothetical protein JHK87_047800 [Glycine soja]
MTEDSVLVIEGADSLLDDDGKPRRTGTAWTASAHIITAVIGAGVLSLAWAMAQLGWIIGIFSILLFAIVNLYTSNLLADCYRSPDPVTGKRNHSYMEANGTAASCRFSTNPYMIALGTVQIVLSQIPNFHNLSWLSIIAAIMSFGYALIGAGLSLATVIQGKGKSTSLMGGNNIQSSADHNLWNMLIALGNIALASCYSQIAVDIQDTLRSSPPENKVMKKANMIGISTMTVFFQLCACSGYAAFGSETPGNILLSSGFKEPFWLIDIANVFIVVHLVGAYQVIVQPIFGAVETWARERWPSSSFINREYPLIIGRMKFCLSFFRLVWRTIFVAVVTILAMAMPFFNEMLALLGAIGFWPITVYFPVEMYIARKKIKKGAMRWLGLKTLSLVFMLLSLAIAIAAIHGMNQALRKYKPFKYKA